MCQHSTELYHTSDHDINNKQRLQDGILTQTSGMTNNGETVDVSERSVSVDSDW